MKQTVLILGAGASADYGYPLWEQLKEQMIDLKDQSESIDGFLDQVKDLTEEERKQHTNAYREFIKLQERYPKYTLDRIVYEIDKHKDKHFEPTGHYLINIAGYLLAQIETENTNKNGWVTNFQNLLINYFLDNLPQDDPKQNLFQNLSIISLNYDRVFEHFISNQFYKKLKDDSRYNPIDLQYSIMLSNTTMLDVIKPHGYICPLSNEMPNLNVGMNQNLIINGNNDNFGFRNPGSYIKTTYGENQILEKKYFLRMGKHMYVVNERNETDYQSANNALKSANVVFCLGLSVEGICQSSLFFQDGQKVYLTNKESELDKINSCWTGPNYESLGASDSYLDAVKFPEVFAQKVF